MIRTATRDDLPAVRELWHAFEAEIPDAPHRDPDAEEDLAQLEADVGNAIVLLAEEDGGAPVGLAAARRTGDRVAFLDLVYVRPEARRSGIAAELMRETASRLAAAGVETLELEVLASNTDAQAAYERWGFEPVELTLAAPVASLASRLERPTGPTFGSIHVQTDDTGAVERAVQKFLPRLGQSGGTSVTGPRNGWIAVHDELCDREPDLVRRLAKELSYALPAVTLAIGVEDGAYVWYTLYDMGGDVDEYASVPEYHGELPPGDVVALGANPTVVARLTGADARAVRTVARTAASPADLPSAVELVREIAEVMGVAEADHGWAAS
ncbi:MAG TPA: GNAT family N-acetyltransferase [Gaiellaceae bacterium]|nr:GNAT family N-acetyltransferase [Gaiellaceae bacterium]